MVRNEGKQHVGKRVRNTRGTVVGRFPDVVLYGAGVKRTKNKRPLYIPLPPTSVTQFSSILKRTEYVKIPR